MCLLSAVARSRSLVASLAAVLRSLSAVGSDETTEGSSGFWESVFWTYTAGFDYSRGDYGLRRDSPLFYMPLGVIADYERFRIQVVVPFIVSDGPTTLRSGPGPPPPPPPRPPLESETNRGVGEIVTSASYLLDPFLDGMP